MFPFGSRTGGKTLSSRQPQLMVTLWPSFPHFSRFSSDSRLSGIRLNSAMISNPELDEELARLKDYAPQVPLYFDVKGRQLRVTEVIPHDDYLDIRLNHPIRVRTPTFVLFKAGADGAMLDRLEEGGRRLIFQAGPSFRVDPGESLHIKDPSLETFGSQFTDVELTKIERVSAAGFSRYFLSYVQSKRDVDEFLELVGRNAEVLLKIEDQKGLRYVAREFRKRPNLSLVAARGDLFVEMKRPHQILQAVKMIIEADSDACVGSRLFLSVVQPNVIDIKRMLHVLERVADDAAAVRNTVARAREFLLDAQSFSCADFHEAAWLYDIGYRRMMLCDELCLREDLLAPSINAFQAFAADYVG